MTATVVRGGRLYDAEVHRFVPGDLLIDGGRIVASGTIDAPAGAAVIDARGAHVAPGFIDTRWLKEGLGPIYEPAKKATAEATPLKRVASPEDVTQVVMSLIEGADFVTGQNVVVDGGSIIH